jgi:hypothetical protein
VLTTLRRECVSAAQHLTIVRLVDNTMYPSTSIEGGIERIVTAYIYARDDTSVPNVQCGDVLRVHRIQVCAWYVYNGCTCGGRVCTVQGRLTDAVC